MKHYYESEILFKLMERDGFNVPSSVPPYESEIKAFLINQVKQAYPKLTDYEAEWLLYNYTKHLPADFPISEVTNATSAHFENVVPFAYQSAILKGSTKYRDIDTGEVLDAFEDGRNLELVSVKMPVLTTTGKNLADQLLPLNSKGDSETTTKIENSSNALSSLIKIRPNQRIVINKNNAGSRFRCFFFDRYPVVGETISIDGLYADRDTTIKVTSPVNSEYLLVVWCNDKNTEYPTNYQVEYGSEKTDWEPYKSNILTVNEDVELGSVGEVKDELNLLTGQLTQRTETRAYQEGDESNSEVITDMANTRYKLPKESIKTVDLTTVDENNEPTYFIPIEGTMNVSSSSETIPPLFDMSVPVEATTQNLASFTNLEIEGE